jgi:hypothetical protein
MPQERYRWRRSGIPATVEVWTPEGARAELIQDYLDFLAAQEVPTPRIRRIARILADATTWMTWQEDHWPRVGLDAWENYLIFHCDARSLDAVPRLLAMVEVLNAWSRFEHWHRPSRWPYHPWPASRQARRWWLEHLVTQPWLHQ